LVEETLAAEEEEEEGEEEEEEEETEVGGWARHCSTCDGERNP
jgi:hypothetical protein